MGQGALRKQSVQPRYSLDERTHGRGWNTNRNWNSTNTGEPGTPNGLRSALVRSQYIPCTDLCYRALTTARPSMYIAHIGVRTRYIAPRQSRERQKGDLRPAVIPIVAYKYQVHCIRYFKVVSIQSFNCKSEKIQIQLRTATKRIERTKPLE